MYESIETRVSQNSHAHQRIEKKRRVPQKDCISWNTIQPLNPSDKLSPEYEEVAEELKKTPELEVLNLWEYLFKKKQKKDFLQNLQIPDFFFSIL